MYSTLSLESGWDINAAGGGTVVNTVPKSITVQSEVLKWTPPTCEQFSTNLFFHDYS